MSVERSLKLIAPYLAVYLFVISLTFYLTINFWPQTNIGSMKKVIINHGATLSNISDKLNKKGIVTNKWVFEFLTNIKGLDKSMQAGIFRVSEVHTNNEVINGIVFGSPDRKKITFLEGWNMSQVAKHLSEQFNFNYTEVLKSLIDKELIKDLNISSNTLEGYLFPETYYFFEGVDKVSVIRRLVKEYKRFWNEKNLIKADSLGFTPYEITILASIIEGEAIYDSERPIISAVYHNRLRIGMKLQADPTVQYIIDDGPRRLLNKDLRIKSPYNTYMYQGLPPGPINSPGKKSLLAALNPEVNNYLYFVAKGDGYHTFSRNEKEHERAKRAFQRVRKKVKRERAGL
tara:strand:- start:574 stop:1608 length:1035 start_codon:yes stop_codon:yes gene_type:complete